VDTQAIASPYPENGFYERRVNADGTVSWPLTAKAHEELAKFFEAYPEPLAAIGSRRVSRNGRSTRGLHSLIIGMVRRNEVSYDDVDAQIRLSVSHGIRLFNPVTAADNGNTLKTYLVWWIKSAVSSLVKRVVKEGSITTLRIGSGREMQEVTGFIDEEILAERPEYRDKEHLGPLDREEREHLRSELLRLPVQLKSVLIQTFWRGRTNKHVGKLIGVSKSRVGQLVRQAKERLADRI